MVWCSVIRMLTHASEGFTGLKRWYSLPLSPHTSVRPDKTKLSLWADRMVWDSITLCGHFWSYGDIHSTISYYRKQCHWRNEHTPWLCCGHQMTGCIIVCVANVSLKYIYGICCNLPDDAFRISSAAGFLVNFNHTKWLYGGGSLWFDIFLFYGDSCLELPDGSVVVWAILLSLPWSIHIKYCIYQRFCS